MHFDGHCRDLGRVPVRALRLAVRDSPALMWSELPLRERRFAVHRETRSVLLLWAEHERFPDVVVQRGPRFAEWASILTPALDAARRAFPHPTRVCNAVLAKLPSGAHIPTHIDSAPFFAAAHRLHIPLLTHPDVRFRVGTAVPEMRPCHLYEINNRLPHAVSNTSPIDRVHLIIDLLPQATTP